MTREEFEQLAGAGVILLDGATGSNLTKAGMPKGVSTELWVLEHPDILANLQKAYVEAGSQIVYAPTFGANRLKLADYGRENEVEELNASPNDVSCPSCSPHRTGYSSVTPETNLFPDSHGLLSVHFPPARMPIPLKHPNRNCFPLQHFFHTQRKPVLLYRQVRKLLPSSFLHLLSWCIVFA